MGDRRAVPAPVPQPDVNGPAADRGVVTLAVVGAGIRGQAYARHAVATGRCQVVAVAEPDPGRRDRFAGQHGLPEDQVFTDWYALAARERLADAVVIATQDRMHVEPAEAFLDRGYHVLLEKPMAPTEPEARRIVAAANASGAVFAVCHVLRYTAYTQALTALLRAGRIGRLVSVQHLEPVGWWHQAHSYVRGNWRREDESGPMLLTKSCHDLDWMIHIVGQPITRISSFGGLAHLRAEDRPDGAGERCVTCRVEPDCPYSAVRLYLGCLGDPGRERWPLAAVTPDATTDGVLDALREGPYGRCVYACDNDVVDHQVVAMEFAGGVSGVFTMTAFTPGGAHRQTRLFGTHGYVEGDGATLRLVDFRDGHEELIDASGEPGGPGSGSGELAGADQHGGGDAGLMRAFLAAVAAGDPGLICTDADASLASHRAVWAAEVARRTGTVQHLGAAAAR